MTRKQRRLTMIGGSLVVLGIAVALVLNAAMFAVEIGAGVTSGSVSLLADSLDFLGDAANYGVSLFVLGASLAWRARTALVKAASMTAFGLWVVGDTYSIADAYLFTVAQWLELDGVDPARYPKVIAHRARMAALPNVAAAIDEEFATQA